MTSDTQTRQARHRAIEMLLDDVLTRRAKGELLPDHEILAAHPTLRPELDAELRAARELEQIRLAAQKAGPAPPAGDPPSPGGLLAAPPESEPARQISIAGYTIIEEIGTGGQGTVFKATQDATSKTVAIKVIPGGPLTGSTARQRFEREAGILAKLDHPLIVTILDRGRTRDGSLFFTMPFIDGVTLDDYVTQLHARGFDLRTILRLFIQIARALADAHREKIIHRDLKPANIRIDRRGQPHILDFGLARAETGSMENAPSITQTGQIVGSLPWTSPEQVSHQRVDSRTDIYSLGIMLYHALTDSYPYTVFGAVRDVLDNIVNAVPAAPSQTPAGQQRKLEADLDAIVLRALAKSPDQRYASATELADDLERHLGGQPLPNETLSASRRKRLIRNIIAVAAATVVLAAGTSGAIWWQSRIPRLTVIELPSCTNTVGMKLLRIPSGSFTMNDFSMTSKATAVAPSGRQHLETISNPFYIGTTEVTQHQYRQVMGELPANQADIGDDLPVQNVSWDEAASFCQHISETEQRTYRLPTSAEWEYACRASARPVNYGGIGRLDEMGWYNQNSGGHYHSVARLSPNTWGLYDMHGNVAEWCSDPVADPVDAGGHASHITRGGSIDSEALACSSAALTVATRNEACGFRVVMEDRDAPPAKQK